VRFKDEADAVLGFGGHLVKIVRPGFGGTDGHSSETSINNFASEMLTCEVENTGDLEFYDATIKHIMKNIFLMFYLELNHHLRCQMLIIDDTHVFHQV